MSNPIVFTIENKRVNASAQGILKFEHIVEHYQTLFQHPDFFQGISAIYDFSLVERMDGSISVFEQIAREMGDSNIVTKESYVAIVVASDNPSMNHIFNAYAQMVDYTLMNVAVVHNPQQAIDWLSQCLEN